MSGDDSLFKTVPFDDLPPETMDQLTPVLLHYSVNLAGVISDEEVEHCGSGTLVTYRDRFYVLTAAHCAERVTDPKIQRVGLAMIGHKHRFFIDHGFPEPPIYVDRPKKWGALGPDMAFLPIPLHQVGIINPRKAFYNLELHEDYLLSRKAEPDRGLWAFVGAPEDPTKPNDPSEFEFVQTVHWTSVAKIPRKRAGHDYLDMRGPLSDVGGVSGGGLWQIDLQETKAGGVDSPYPPNLEGCAFFQFLPKGDQRLVRCHGRQSLYGRGLQALRDRYS